MADDILIINLLLLFFQTKSQYFIYLTSITRKTRLIDVSLEGAGVRICGGGNWSSLGKPPTMNGQPQYCHRPARDIKLGPQQ